MHRTQPASGPEPLLRCSCEHCSGPSLETRNLFSSTGFMQRPGSTSLAFKHFKPMSSLSMAWKIREAVSILVIQARSRLQLKSQGSHDLKYESGINKCWRSPVILRVLPYFYCLVCSWSTCGCCRPVHLAWLPHISSLWRMSRGEVSAIADLMLLEICALARIETGMDLRIEEDFTVSSLRCSSARSLQILY